MAPHQQGVKAEAGLGDGYRVARAETGHGHQVQQGAAGGAQQQAARGGPHALPEPLGELALAFGVLVERQIAEARQ